MTNNCKSVQNAILSLSICLVLCSCVSNKAKILIIGDSISIGYTPYVKESLRQKAQVYHNPKNAQHTKVGLKKINSWVKKKNWDIIQFNWGLWDMCYRVHDKKPPNKDIINGTITVELEEYATNLDSIISIIKMNSNAKLIFVTTTHVPDNNKGRHSEDVHSYNQTAKNVMKKNGVAINDIYDQSVIIHNQLGKAKDDAHYSTTGYQELGKLITPFLEKELKKLPRVASLQQHK